MGAACALFPKTRRRLLGLFFSHPERKYHVRQVSSLTRCGQGAVHRELARLLAAGLLTRSRQGRQVIYQANPASPVFREVQGLVLKTVGLADVLREALAPLSGQIVSAFVFGSLASGAAGPDSDVDVMVIGDVGFAQVVAALRPTQEAVAREVNPAVYTAEEFAERLSRSDHFLMTVVQGRRMHLLGDEHGVDRLAQTGMGSGAPNKSPGDC